MNKELVRQTFSRKFSDAEVSIRTAYDIETGNVYFHQDDVVDAISTPEDSPNQPNFLQMAVAIARREQEELMSPTENMTDNASFVTLTTVDKKSDSLETESAIFISESLFYRYVLQSGKLIALIVQTWITRDVLPAIRSPKRFLAGGVKLPVADTSNMKLMLADKYSYSPDLQLRKACLDYIKNAMLA